MAKEPTYYPLTTAQNIMYVSQKYSFKKSIVDVCSMIHFDCDMDEKLLMQALYMALLRNESSRVRLHKVGKEIKQYLSDQAPEAIIVMDYSDRTQEELDADLNAWSKTPFPGNSMDTQLYSIRMIKEPSGFWGIYFCVSHLAFDAYCLMSLASDMISIYIALRDEKPISPYKGDYLRLCKTDWDYQASDKVAKDVEFWDKEGFTEEPVYCNVEEDKPLRTKGKNWGKTINILDSSAYHVNLKMPAEINRKVLALAAEMRVSPQCFYLLAVRSYLSRINGDEEKIMMMNTVARRASLLQKRSGGMRVLALPFFMYFPKDTKVKDALVKMAALQAAYYSHSDLLVTQTIGDIPQRKYGKPADKGYHSVSVTYNPYSVQLPEDIKAHFTTYSNGANTLNIYLSIMALDNSGDLNFNYDCCNYATTPETAGKMHTQITKALEAIVANPEMTLVELNRL